MLLVLGNLNLDLDFDYRIIREENDDVDIFIDINYRSLDIDTDGSNLFNSRIQFPFVRALILRLNKNNHYMTIHLLRDIDLFSAFANFEVDYTDSIINIKNQNEKVILNKSIKK
ncbi:hypothetical protein [Clostridioides sp. ZZV15-6598]|uniref:hypothetical protein n=1 Tax=Clostridioides sp. ZZV15-6598 TaxID=2811501 RepID=UPI001D109AC1|nr:hypothetical protein [Clostridioides sp. ZZV15-6598]